MSGFRAALLHAATENSLRPDGRFMRALRGPSPAPVIHAYAAAMYLAAKNFPLALLAMCSITPEVEVRRRVLNNLIEEEGFQCDGKRRELQFDEARAHLTWARRFALAAGWSDAALDTLSARGSRDLNDYLTAGDWFAALGYLCIGFEYNVPPACVMISDRLRELGYTEHDLTFFSAHIQLDSEHGLEGVELAETYAQTSQQRESVLHGVRRGVREWRLMHDMCARAGHGCAPG